MLRLELQTNYVGSSRAFLALLDGELNALTFVQGFEAGGLDSGEVYEHVFAAVSREMKPKPFSALKNLTVPVILLDIIISLNSVECHLNGNF